MGLPPFFQPRPLLDTSRTTTATAPPPPPRLWHARRMRALAMAVALAIAALALAVALAMLRVHGLHLGAPTRSAWNAASPSNACHATAAMGRSPIGRPSWRSRPTREPPGMSSSLETHNVGVVRRAAAVALALRRHGANYRARAAARGPRAHRVRA